ncbi:MAG: hypothetical protein V7756_14460 [Halopseudomonas sp.]|uniref:hypothetical protein n=1 Tax=Halopseudomonas sp. TaxID=2901191 RepID=UPI003002AA3F
MQYRVLGATLLGLLSLGQVQAADRSLALSSSASYYDPQVIADNILSECTELGASFSRSTEKYLREQGWSVVPLNAEPAAGDGKQIKLQVINALSSGNAFLGHRKSVSIMAQLYENGQLIDTYRQTRNSSGGFGGPFKGSCEVLYRCTNTLGNDVAKWMADK